MKKLLLIFVVLLTFSCHQAPKPETTSFDTKFEILHGKVKQLQEFYRAGKEAGGDTDITDFDIHGNLVQTKRTGSSNAIIKYDYDYGTGVKKIAVMTNEGEELVPVIYKYDTNGLIVEEVWNATELTPASDSTQNNIFKYDPAGNRIEESYSYKNYYSYTRRYKYNDKHLLLEELYFESGNKKPESKISYRYTSFDSKGNWLRRVGKTEDYGPPRQEISEPVVTRKITYY